MVVEGSKIMKKIYCIHCGKKNPSSNKYCNYCHKKLKERDRVLYDYIFDQTLSDIKDNALGTFFDKIKYILKKYLYGIILSITVVTSVVSNIVIRNNYSEVVEEKPIFIPKEVIKYNSPNDLMLAFDNYFIAKDEENIKMLLFDNVYPSESLSLGIDTSKMPYVYDSSVIKDINLVNNIDYFSQDNMKIMYNVMDMKEVPSDELKYYGDLVVKLVESSIDTYVAETSFVYYNELGEEETYFDLDFILISKDNSYYIAGINYYNPDNRIEEFLENHK